MAQTKVDRLAALGMAPELAKEIDSQISAGALTGVPTAVANVSAAPTQAEFNGLLAALRERGVIY